MLFSRRGSRLPISFPSVKKRVVRNSALYSISPQARPEKRNSNGNNGKERQRNDNQATGNNVRLTYPALSASGIYSKASTHTSCKWGTQLGGEERRDDIARQGRWATSVMRRYRQARSMGDLGHADYLPEQVLSRGFASSGRLRSRRKGLDRNSV
ncbi:hypothetical protein L202_04037 [Cryptococcus amylolentus CBS 6039]|uniref:Uncharacterized protein n=1 Tax=Cryptococcus amylolentus CBS 6039 TaxID=1295533 RepID=A0A1E3HPX4_9TREE|nr:hypothetical protein L202_04037 [Cryptococcus amylolentus CBS 6039]ODN78398.1 hypothetical protein L202_04037 [Cryptococcus amylolentus CBS 6039]